MPPEAHNMRKLLLTFVLALTLCMPSLAAETWNVGTWKTAQTIQPFLYEPFANGATVKVHPFTNPGDQKAALLAGSLDMTGTTLAKRQGYGEILAYPYYGEGIGAINSGMIVRRDFVEKNPERVMEMLRAHRKATEQCMSDKAFWLETSSKMFGVELDVLRDAADNMELVWDMDDTFMKQLSALGKRMLELGIIKKEPDYNALVERRFVDALREGK